MSWSASGQHTCRHRRPRLRLSHRPLALAIVLICSPPATAATLTWTGASGTTNNWSDTDNWSPVASPTDGDTLIFAGSTRLSPFNNVGVKATLEFASGASAFTLVGDQGLPTTGITNRSNNMQTIDLTNNVVVNENQTWDAGTAGLTVNTPIYLNFIDDQDTLTITGSGDTILNQDIFTADQPWISYKIAKTGSGTLTLSGTNTYRHGTNINGGTVVVGADANLGSSSGPVNLDGGTLRTTASFSTIRNGTLGAGGGTFLTDAATTLTHSGALSGAGALTKSGDGTLIQSGNNSYTGGTTISAGTLQIGAGGTTGAISGNVTNNSSLVFNRSDDLTYAGDFSGTGSLTKLGAGTLTLSGISSQTGGGTVSVDAGRLAVSGGNAIADSYVLQGSGEFELLSDETIHLLALSTGGKVLLNDNTLTLKTISDYAGNNNATISGTGNIVIEGAGSQRFGVANTYTGSTTINGGQLGVDNSSALGIDSAVTVNSGGKLALTEDLIIGSLAGDGLVSLKVSTLPSYNLTSGGDDTSSVFSGVISGADGSLTKTGTGTFTLTGSNTYTGTTTVNGGTLAVDGSITSATTVNSGATLGGSGSVAGTVTVTAGATLAPGNSAGTLTVNELLLDDTSVLDFELGDPAGDAGIDSDLIEVNGNLTLDGVLNITDLGSFGAGTYRLIDYTGTLTDNTLTVGTLPPGYAATVDTETPGQVNLVVTQNPYTITVTTGAGGSANCEPDPALGGDPVTCTVTANSGYTRSSTVGGTCPDGSWSGSTWTTGAIVADCSVSFSFNAIPEPATYLVAVTTGTGGSASCSPTTVEENASTTCTVTADAGYTPDSTITGTCPSGSWSGSTWTSGAITDDCTVGFAFTPTEPEPYDDGTVSCAVGDCTATDNEDGSRTVEGSFTDPDTGALVSFTVTTSPDGGVDITLTTPDGTPTRVTSAVPGSTVEVSTDEEGRPRVTTRAELADGTTLEVVIDADGYLTHRVTHLDGTVTETVVSLAGAEVAIDAEGRLSTTYSVEHGEALWRMVVETNADGTAVARYERFDPATGEWVTERQLTDPISPLEAGHRVWMEDVPGVGLRLRARMPVSSSLYF